MRKKPTPARASNDASADPVAPQPTIATRDAASCIWPSAPIGGKRIWREYRSPKSNDCTCSVKGFLVYYRDTKITSPSGLGERGSPQLGRGGRKGVSHDARQSRPEKSAGGQP